MLLEALHYAMTLRIMQTRNPAAVKSAVSLWSRARRCAKAWGPHERLTKAAIKANCTDLPRRRTVVVLGSGLLRDVPIDFLAQEFRKVILIDIVHLALVQWCIRRQDFENVVLVERDLSGLDSLHGKDSAAGESQTADLKPLSFLHDIADLDLVISANLLSQIGIGAERRIIADGLPLKPDDVRRLIEAHLAGLAALSCRALLITDTGWEEVTRDGTVTDQFDLMHGAVLPSAQMEWDWPVAPFGEISRKKQVIHRVIACQFPGANADLKPIADEGSLS
jgi:hypothetical protein